MEREDAELDVDPRFPRPMSRAAWDQLVETGALDKQRIELIRGAVVRMSPIGTAHWVVTDWFMTRLLVLLTPSYRVSGSGALPMADESKPQPDVMVVAPTWTRKDAPRTAFLVIEVADSSLRYDLSVKRELYAESGVPEYWVVDVERTVVHVHTQPEPTARRYASVMVLGEGDTLRPTLLPAVALEVRDIPR